MLLFFRSLSLVFVLDVDFCIDTLGLVLSAIYMTIFNAIVLCMLLRCIT